MKLGDVWFTTLAQSEDGSENVIFVSGREHIAEFINSGKFKERAEVTWKYQGDAKGMPDDKTAELMEEVQEALKKSMEKDKLAILTGIYTGNNERVWIFITRNVAAFGQKLNEALSGFELLPISIYTEKDPENNEYKEMLELKLSDEE
ncbi:MAG: DUF695 domain-containing protein [Bacteroidales bacterium]|nr:DUF695 domain-containing protein [Bacteroidales bacterium]